MLIDSNSKVWIYTKYTDMRKSIDGLSIVIADQLELNPSNGEIFVFCNKKQDKLKILYWHINGFCLFYKRLEKQRFKMPALTENKIVVGLKELRWLLEGLDFTITKGHKPLRYNDFF